MSSLGVNSSASGNGIKHEHQLQPQPQPPFSSPLDGVSECLVFAQHFDETLRAGDCFAVLPAKWWEAWQAYTGFDRNKSHRMKQEYGRDVAAGNGMMDAADVNGSEIKGIHGSSGAQRPGRIDCTMLLQTPPADLELRSSLDESEDVKDEPMATSDDGDTSMLPAATSAASSLHPSSPPHHSSHSSLTSSSTTSSLTHSWLALRPELQEGEDFVLINQAAFNKLLEWYGGGPAILRPVIRVGLSGTLIVDLHPLMLLTTPVCAPTNEAETLSTASPQRINVSQRRIRSYSKTTTLNEIIADCMPREMLDAAAAVEAATHEDAKVRGLPSSPMAPAKKLSEAELRARVEGRIWRPRTKPLSNSNDANGHHAMDTTDSGNGTTTSTLLPNGKRPNALHASTLSMVDFTRAWEVIPPQDLTSKLDFIDEIVSGMDLIIEYRLHTIMPPPVDPKREMSEDGQSRHTLPWALFGSGKKDGEEWKNLEEEDEFDCLDEGKTWFQAVVQRRQLLPSGDIRILIHYLGWGVRYDQTLIVTPQLFDPSSAEYKFAQLYTYTNGPHVRKIKNQVTTNNDIAYYSGSSNRNISGRPAARGAVGLRNLGNTCFFNSTVQCLANAPGLTEFFIEGRYMRYLNRSNPLGFKGRIAEEYGATLKEMWSGEYSVVNPKSLKYVIGEFQPRFAGWQQQDSSELLQFLLDGLHEDLNRVITKPVTTPVESNGRPDKVVAEESWERHLQRNKSVIVDLFQGQLKSRVVCPFCHRQSLTFDPFTFLSVPLPLTNTRKFQVIVVHTGRPKSNATSPISPSSYTNGTGSGSGSAIPPPVDSPPFAPQLWPVRIGKGGTCMEDLKAELINLTSSSPSSAHSSSRPRLTQSNLIMCDIHSSKVFKVMAADHPLNRLAEKDLLFAYCVPELDANIQAGEEKFTTLQCTHLSNVRPMPIRFGLPTVLALPSKELRSMSMLKLRQAARDALESWMNGGHGWMKGDVDKDLYNIWLMDRQAERVIEPLPYTDAGGNEDFTVDLQGAATAFHQGSEHVNALPGFSFAFEWKLSRDQLRSRLIQSHLDIHHPSHLARSLMSKAAKAGLDLNDCLAAFSREETLRKSEAWYCSKCKEHVEATKKFDLWKTPDLLIIHLKRFTYDQYRRDKITVKVDFPLENLDLSPFIVNEEEKSKREHALYDLFAVSNHYGGLGGGHYTACAKNLINKRWYNLDDSSVSPIDDPNSVRDAAAYVLFYKRESKFPE